MQEHDPNWTPGLVLQHLLSHVAGNDKRYEERFLAQEKAVNAALAAAEKAVLVAEKNGQDWREGANEWRAAMSDRERTFATQADVLTLKERLDKNEGGGKGMRDFYGWVVAAIMSLATIYSLFIGKK